MNNITISKEAFKAANNAEAQREMLFDGIFAIHETLKDKLTNECPPHQKKTEQNSTSIKWLTWAVRAYYAGLIGICIYIIRMQF